MLKIKNKNAIQGIMSFLQFNKEESKSDNKPVYRADEIAAYIIDKSISDGNPVSNLKLQKLLYYVQAASLLRRNEVLFSDDIVAWRYGPVVKIVYNIYKYYSRDDINERTGQDHSNIDEESREIIDLVLEKKAKCSAIDLVEATHNEQPWIETNLNDVIPISTIREYFSKNEGILW